MFIVMNTICILFTMLNMSFVSELNVQQKNTSLLSTLFSETSQLLTHINPVQEEIEVINQRIEQLFLSENIELLTSLYSEQLTYFPEYKPAIFNIKGLKKFYRDWFKVTDFSSYRKKIYTVEVYADYILEIGTSRLTYASDNNPNNEYKCKYMVMWKKDDNEKLKIISETFGAEKYIEPNEVPYATVTVEASNFVERSNVTKQVMREIEESNAIVIKAVAEGDADARANGFTNDGILMSTFDSMQVGMEAIRAHMFKTYNPDISFIVKHSYNRIYDLGDYVFLTGHYKGGWGDSIKGGGKFEGNMSNFMKRDKSGKLLMYRQIGNRVSKLIVYKGSL
jgi:ketosteroid isomerase-like protein